MQLVNTLKIFVLPLLVFWICSISISVKIKADEKSTDQSHDAMMEKWKEFATPGENHKLLDPLVGNWDYIVKWWMTPDAKPEESRGTSEVKWIMGGRFLEQTARGVSMGQPFQGMGIIGYDNAEKQYRSFWIDNMGTGIMRSSGNYEASKKEIVETGRFTDPTEGVTIFHGVTKIVDQNKFTYEMYVPGPDAKEFRTLKIVYTRKK